MLLVELCSKKSYFIVSEINAEGSYIRMSGVQLHARISFKAQSNWMLSKYFFPSLDMKLSGDPTQYFFLRKIFSLPMKANARYKYIWSFWSFFFFFIVCFCLTSLWCSFILVGIRWNCQFASLRIFFSHRSNPSSFFSSSWKSTKGKRSSCQKLNQATHCIKTSMPIPNSQENCSWWSISPYQRQVLPFSWRTRSDIDSTGLKVKVTAFHFYFFQH